MKKLQIYRCLMIALVLLLLDNVVLAQPLPPENPYGNPVPVGGAIGIFLALAAVLGVRQLKKKNN